MRIITLDAPALPACQAAIQNAYRWESVEAVIACGTDDQGSRIIGISHLDHKAALSLSDSLRQYARTLRPSS